MSKVVFDQTRPVLEAWLARCEQKAEIAAAEDYLLYAFKHDALGSGTLELMDNPDLSQGHDVVAMAMVLNLPEPETKEDFYNLLTLCEWTTNASIVRKDLDGDGYFALQVKFPAAGLTAETLEHHYKELLASKRFIEEE